MYHAETDTPAVARTSNLNEELGQVSVNLDCFAFDVWLLKVASVHCHLTSSFYILFE